MGIKHWKIEEKAKWIAIAIKSIAIKKKRIRLISAAQLNWFHKEIWIEWKSGCNIKET